MPDFCPGVYQCGMHRISPETRCSENDFNASKNVDSSHSQNNGDVMSTEPDQSTPEKEESCDKCGRIEIPIQIEYQAGEPENIPKRENKDSKSLKKEMDGLKTRLDYFDKRFRCIEKALFSNKD